MLDKLALVVKGVAQGEGHVLTSAFSSHPAHDLRQAELHATALLEAMAPTTQEPSAASSPTPATPASAIRSQLCTLLTLPDQFFAFVVRTTVQGSLEHLCGLIKTLPVLAHAHFLLALLCLCPAACYLCSLLHLPSCSLPACPAHFLRLNETQLCILDALSRRNGWRSFSAP
jgi:hypothetical protein